MTKSVKARTVGPWARQKLDALGQYLNFYTTVLKNQDRWLSGTIFVDAFAGPGLSSVRARGKPVGTPGLFDVGVEFDEAEIEYLKGSPRVALDIANPFTAYIFIDNDAARAADLKLLQEEYAGARTIEIRRQDANVALQAWLARGIDWKHHRAVVFLDPFGMQVPWSIIEALAKTKAIEVLINFPLGMAIQRLLTNSGEIPENWQKSLDTFFGSPDWRGIVYQEGADLFGPKRRKLDDSGLRLVEWYRARLKASFGHVSTPYLIRNMRGNPLYYLIWAGPHKKGLDGANYILSKGEQVLSLRRSKMPVDRRR